MAKQLTIIRLIEPELCLECRFAHEADVEQSDGEVKTMIYCKRLACDNWDMTNAQPAKRMTVDNSYEIDSSDL